MIITRYACSMFNADHIQLPAGEKITTPDSAVNARVYGVCVLSGGYKISAADEAKHRNRAFARTGDFVPNTILSGATAQALGDTSWLCFSANDATQRTVSQLVVNGTATLPADTGFFVASGTVQADGKTANQFQFFRPRPVSLQVQGDATLILVR